MRFTLGLTGLYDRFEGRIFSVDEVTHGKPAPDLFLHAAERMGADPAACAVVEDSRFGVEAARAASLSGIRKQVFVIVNATMRHSQEEDSRPDTPGLLRELRSLADIPIDRFSTGSIETLKREVLRWRAQLYFASDEQLGHIIERDTDFYVIEVSLAAPAEGQRPPRLSEASTSLRISPDDSRALQRYARDALAGSKEWQRLLRDLGSQPPSLRDAAGPASVDGSS